MNIHKNAKLTPHGRERMVRACVHKSKALSCKYLSVGTHPDNLEAQAFYASFGFKRRDSFPPGFVMRLED